MRLIRDEYPIYIGMNVHRDEVVRQVVERMAAILQDDPQNNPKRLVVDAESYMALVDLNEFHHVPCQVDEFQGLELVIADTTTGASFIEYECNT